MMEIFSRNVDEFEHHILHHLHTLFFQKNEKVVNKARKKIGTYLESSEC
jgi:hypothetical protein